MIQILDPYWKMEPDLVADESFRERYVWDDEDDEDPSQALCASSPRCGGASQEGGETDEGECE